MRTIIRCLSLALTLLLAFPPHLLPAAAQQPAPPGPGKGIGVVTALQGEATVARAALPQPQRLRFRDDVFLRDQITTREKSTVRLLLGGKGTLTIREQSQVTLDTATTPEGATRSFIGLLSGKIGAAVARALMRSGDEVEVRTPNAVAAVRGTVFIAEYIPPRQSAEADRPILLASGDPRGLLAQAGSPAGGTSNFFVLSGSVTITPQGQSPLTLGPLQTVSVTTAPGGTQAGQVSQMTPQQAQQAAQGLGAGKPHTGEAETAKTAQAQAQVAAAVAEAVVQATGGTPSPTTGGVSTETPSAPTITADTPPITEMGGGGESGATSPVPVTENVLPEGPVVTFSNSLALGVTTGTALATLAGGAANTVSPVTFAGPGTATITAPILAATGSPVTHAGPLVALGAGSSIVGATGEIVPLVSVTGTTLTNTGWPLLDVSGGSRLTLEGPLFGVGSGGSASLGGVLSLASGSEAALGPAPAVQVPNGTALATDEPLFNVVGLDSSLNTYAGAPLVFMDPSTLTLGAPLLTVSDEATATLTGPALHTVNSTVTGVGLAAVSYGTLSIVNTPFLLSESSALSFSGPMTALGESWESIHSIGTQPLYAVSGGTLVLSGSGALLAVDDGYVELGGPLLSASSVAIDARGTANPLIGLTNYTELVQSSPAPLVSVSGGSVLLSTPLLALSLANISLTGSFFAASGTVITGGAAPLVTAQNSGLWLGGNGYGGHLIELSNGAQLAASAPVARVQGSSWLEAVRGGGGEGGSLISLNSGARLNAAGTLLDIQEASVTLDGPIFALRGGSQATMAGGPAVKVVTGSLVAGGGFGESDGAGNVVTFTGAGVPVGSAVLIDALGSNIFFGPATFPEPTVDTDVITITAPAGVPLIRLDNSALVDSDPDRSLLELSPGATPFAGLLLLATNDSYLETNGPLFEVCCGDSVTSTAARTSLAQPLVKLIEIDNSAVAVNGSDVLRVSDAGTQLNVASVLLEAGTGTTSSIAADGGSLLRVQGGAAVTIASPVGDPLLMFSHTDVETGQDIVTVTGSGSRITLNASPLLTGDNWSYFASANHFLTVDGGAQITSSAPTLLGLTNNSILDVPGAFVYIGNSVITVGGSLLTASNSMLHVGGPAFVEVQGGTLNVTAPTVPLIALSGGHLELWNGGSLLAVTGTAPSPAQVILAGSLIVTSNSQLTMGSFLRMDGGSLSANSLQPLIDLWGMRLTRIPDAFPGRDVLVGATNGAVISTHGPLFRADGTAFEGAVPDALIGLLGSSLSAGTGLTGAGIGSLLDLHNTSMVLDDGAGNLKPVVYMEDSALSANGPAVKLVNSELKAHVLISLGAGTTGNTLQFGGAFLEMLNSQATLTSIGEDPDESVTSFTQTLGPTEPTIRMTNSSLTVLGSEPLVDPGSDFSTDVQGLGLIAAGGVDFHDLTLNAPLLNLGIVNLLHPTATHPYIQLQDMTVTLNPGSRALIAIQSPGNVTTGPLLEAINTAFELGGSPFFGMDSENAVLTSTGVSPLFNLNGAYVNTTNDPSHSNPSGGSPFAGIRRNGTLNLAGPLLASDHTNFYLWEPLLGLGGEFILPGDPPIVESTLGHLVQTGANTSLVQMNGGTARVYSESPFIGLMHGSTLSLSGGLLHMTGGADVYANGALLALSGGGYIASSTSGPLVRLTGSTVESPRDIFHVTGSGSLIDLAGSLLQANNSSVGFGHCLLAVEGGAVVTTTDTSAPLFDLNGGTMTSFGSTRAVVLQNGTVSLSGGLLRVAGGANLNLPGVELVQLSSGSSLTIGGPLVEVDGATLDTDQATFLGYSGPSTLTQQPGSGPLVRVHNGILTFGGLLFQTGIDVTATLSGSVLEATGVSTVNMMSSYLAFFGAGGTAIYNLPPGTPLVSLNASTLNSSGHATFGLWGGTLPVPLLRAENGSLITGSDKLALFASGPMIVTTTLPLIQLTNSTLANDGSDGLLAVDGTATLNGPLFASTLSNLAVGYPLLQFGHFARLDYQSLDPLIKIDGGIHNLGEWTDINYPSLLRARTETVDPVSGIGTAEVLRTQGGPLIEMANTNVTLQGTGNAIKVDQALINAGLATAASILKLTNSTLDTSLTGDASGMVNLVKGQLSMQGAAFTLDNSTLRVNNGPLLNLTGGSQMTVNGDFSYLTNGAKIFVQNGPLISVSGQSSTGLPSTLHVTGSLVNFGSPGNQVIINNGIAPNGFPQSNGVTIPVYTATGGTVNVGANAILNPAGNTFSVTGSAIQATGGGKVGINAAP